MTLRGLYAVTPEPLSFAKVETALKAGIALLQYRRKARDAAEAREVVALARRHGVPVIVNDDLELALEAGADGVHLGRDDAGVAAARVRAPDRIIGASCYNDLGLARQAVREGASYEAFGSVFASPTKPDAVRAPLSLFAQAKPLRVPLCAIGGVTLENAPALIEAGADMLAVITDVFEAPDMAARVRQYRKLFA